MECQNNDNRAVEGRIGAVARHAPQGKHWAGCTLNNYIDEDIDVFENIRHQLQYYVVGKERGENGTPHLQFMLCFIKKKKLSTVQNLLGFSKPAHLELKSSRSSMKEASDYCKKDGDFLEWGILPQDQTAAATKASAEIWAETKEKAISDRLEEIIPEHFIKYYPTLKKIRSDHRLKLKPRTLDWLEGKPPNLWIYGVPGVGKSRYAREILSDPYIKAPQNKWWGGYEDQEDVLIDDIRMEHGFQLGNLITWCDRYPFQAEIKCDTTGMIRPKRIVVTSNFHPDQIWTRPEDIDSICRRFQLIKKEKLTPVDTSSNMKKRARVKQIQTTPSKKSTSFKSSKITGDGTPITQQTGRQMLNSAYSGYCIICHLRPCICKTIPRDDDSFNEKEIIEVRSEESDGMNEDFSFI